MHKSALNIVRFALVTSGTRVIAFGDRVEDLDNMKIALRGIVLNLDNGVERYREISGMILEPGVRATIDQVKAMSNKLAEILRHIDPQNPNMRLRKVVKDYVLFIHARARSLQGSVDRRCVAIMLQLCDRLEQGVDSLTGNAPNKREPEYAR